jgi:hypothetical protein
MAITRLKTLIQFTHRAGCVTQRYTISREEGERIKELERTKGHDAACAELLRVLFQPKR